MSWRLWPWLLCGFMATFIIVAMSIRIVVIRPAGDAAVSVKLYEYYIQGIRWAFGPRLSGPASSSRGAFLENAVLHLGVSLLGGLALTGIGWWIGGRSRKQKGPDVGPDVN